VFVIGLLALRVIAPIVAAVECDTRYSNPEHGTVAAMALGWQREQLTLGERNMLAMLCI